MYVNTVYELCKVCTDCAKCVHVCNLATDYIRVNVYVHSVYKLCTVSTCMHSVYKLYNSFSIRNVHTYTQAPYINMVFVYTYTYMRVRRVYIVYKSRIRIRTYLLELVEREE